MSIAVSGGDVVVRARRRVIDERDERIGGSIPERGGIEGVEIDVEQVDERAVLLVGDVAAVEDVSLVDPGVGGDPTEGKRAGEAVGIGVVVTDDGEFGAAREQVMEVVSLTHSADYRCYTLRNT